MASKLNSRLIIARKSKGESQKAMAQAIGVSQVMISNIETGKRMGSPKMLAKIAKHLDKSVDYLFFEENNS